MAVIIYDLGRISQSASLLPPLNVSTNEGPDEPLLQV